MVTFGLAYATQASLCHRIAPWGIVAAPAKALKAR